ncbi:MAG: KTSC domain-containing protein [Candidatus Competibacteraceae bacterium]|nr:KTSC domain-containing protein [Candidatus Competibacteraceae bacterium]
MNSGNGKRYVFHGVGSETMQQAQEAPSFGKFFHSGIKGKFDSKELVPPDPNKEAQA